MGGISLVVWQGCTEKSFERQQHTHKPLHPVDTLLSHSLEFLLYYLVEKSGRKWGIMEYTPKLTYLYINIDGYKDIRISA